MKTLVEKGFQKISATNVVTIRVGSTTRATVDGSFQHNAKVLDVRLDTFPAKSARSCIASLLDSAPIVRMYSYKDVTRNKKIGKSYLNE